MSTTNVHDIPKLSFDEVWAITQESARLIQEINKTRQKDAKKIKKQRQKDAKRAKEKQQETEKKIAEVWTLVKQTDEQIKRTEAQLKRTDEQLGKLGNRFGEVEEYLVAPSIVEKFNEFNYHFNSAGRNIKIYGENKQKIAEVDIMLENNDFILCVEVKVKPDESDIRKHIERLKIVQHYYKNRYLKEIKVIGAIAGTVFDDKLKNLVIENGLYVIVPTGNTFKIDVPEGFQPKSFCSE
ncbi:MAG: hypothetical protein LBI18_12555 [Planctomycetaceae bacterium]|jgi:hypothetical protein|nr:hypothetical protein [Planctomycetaceae bacterium]